jgi:hypothetical protein
MTPVRRFAAVAGAVVALVFTAGTQAHAHDASAEQPFDVTVLGAQVTHPDGSVTEVGETDAAAFVTRWFGPAIFGKLAHEAPPATVGVDHVRVSMVTTTGDFQELLVDVAKDRGLNWVSMPPQRLSWAEVTTQTWMRAPVGTAALLSGVAEVRPVSTQPRERGIDVMPWIVPALVASFALILLFFAVQPTELARRYRRSLSSILSGRGPRRAKYATRRSM